MKENPDPDSSIVLEKMKSIIDKNEETSKILGKSKQDLKESKDQCNEDLKNFYLATTKKLEEAYVETRDLVEQEYDKLRGKFEEREKIINKSTYALMPQIMKLAGSKVSETSINESRDILTSHQEAMETTDTFPSIIFNFIPNSKLRKPKLGFLQLCNGLPSDFKLRILTPTNCISIGKQVDCGIEGEVTTENIEHLEFSIRKETCIISSEMCVAEDKLIKFSFCPEAEGEYSVVACLFGQPIKHSPRSVLVSSCKDQENHVAQSRRENEQVMVCDSSTSSPCSKQVTPQKQVESKRKMSDIANRDEVCSSSNDNVTSTTSKYNGFLADGGWKVGDRCIAKWEDDQVWYNATVNEIQQDGKVSVTFVDYGNSDTVTKLVKDFDEIPEEDTFDENVGPSEDKERSKGVQKENTEEKQQNFQDVFNTFLEKSKNNDRNVTEKIEKEEQTLKTEEIPRNINDSLCSENKFSIGDICVARWEEDGVWYNGRVEAVKSDWAYVIHFVDYGNSENVSAPFIVQTGADIPKEVGKDEIDENVNTSKGKEDNNEIPASEMKNDFAPSVGDVCVARWDEDCVWYNAKVEAANMDGSFTVNFFDYGNSEMVRAPYLVKSASDIPEEVPKENIDEHVNVQGNGKILTEELEMAEGNGTVQEVVAQVSAVEKTTEFKAAGGESKIEQKAINVSETGGGKKMGNVIGGSKTAGESTAGEASPDGVFSIGDVCVAKWSEDQMWYNGLVTELQANGYVVMFSDYGNSAFVEPTNIVKNASCIPKAVATDQIDEHVEMAADGGAVIEDSLPKTLLTGSSSDKKFVDKSTALFSIGESCVARWEEDQVWYNGRIINDNQDGSFVVNFVDYGNSETIFASSIVKDGSKIPATISTEQIDANVNTKAPEKKCETTDKAESEVKPSTFSCGDICVARWDEDSIWYNGKIKKINNDGSFLVEFVDYGNTEVVKSQFIVQTAEDIPKSVSQDEIDENVLGKQLRNPPAGEKLEIQEKPDKQTKPNEAEPKEIEGKVKTGTLTKPREKSSPPVPRPLKQVQYVAPKAPTPSHKWQPGDTCLAQWSEDSVWYMAVVDQVNGSGSYKVTFSDYGNQEEVQPGAVVRDYGALLETEKELSVDVHVQKETSQDIPEISKQTKQNWSVGEECIAMWEDDKIWYNAKIQHIFEDGSFKVIFVDYGNSDVVQPPFMVKYVKQISQQSPVFDENVVTGKELVETEKDPSAMQVNSSEVTPRKVEPTGVSARSQCSSPPSRNSEMIKSLLTPEQLRIMNGASVITSFDILKSVTHSVNGARQLPVKKTLSITQDVKEPIGITVLQNRNIVIASTGDDSVKMFDPSGNLISKVESGKPFKRPSDMFTLSTGDFVIRDDLGLHLFTEEGAFLRDLGQDHIDRCYGVTEDEKGRIVTINSAKAFPNSKPGSKGRGGQTDVGESDIFYIDPKTGAVVRRIELVDIVEDKAKSKCRFLNSYKGQVFIVDLGLDCVYVVNTDGSHAEKFGKSGKGLGEFLDPAGLVLDDFGNMIVADSRNHRLQVFSSNSKPVGVVKVDAPLKRPSGIYLDKKYRELYVLNYWGNSMVKYRIA